MSQKIVKDRKNLSAKQASVHFAANLTKLRERLMISQGEMAYNLIVARPTLSNYENGSQVPTLLTLVRMSQFFGMSLDDLILKEVV